MKTIIIGNSGSGKTWLAAKLAETASLSVIHLDELFWEPGGFDKKRPKETVLQLVEHAKANPAWIVEGVFGELAERFSDQADFLVWLDIDWTTCRERLIRRGSASKKYMGREQSEAGLRKLIEWASHYYDRTDLRSHTGHRDLFQRFRGQKIHIHSEEQTNMIVKYAHQSTAADALARAALAASREKTVGEQGKKQQGSFFHPCPLAPLPPCTDHVSRFTIPSYENHLSKARTT